MQGQCALKRIIWHRFTFASVKRHSSLRELHEKALSNGSPEVYKERASRYEEYALQHLGYSGYKSVVSKWQDLYKTLPPLSSLKYKIFDAGCGTGLIGDELESVLPSFHSNIALYGGDSPDMLAIAEAKGIYEELKIVNLKEKLPYPAESFDSVLCAGVFVQGHCGPDSLNHIVRVLKKKCFLIATIRVLFYEGNKEAWMEAVTNCNCQLVEEILVPYCHNVQGIILVIKKC